VLAKALAHGTTASLWSNAGIVVGDTVYFLLSATILGAVLLTSYDAFLRHEMAGRRLPRVVPDQHVLRPRRDDVHTDERRARHRRSANAGRRFVLHVANPNAVILFAALLPQFIDLPASVAAQVTILAGPVSSSDSSCSRLRNAGAGSPDGHPAGLREAYQPRRRVCW